MADNIASLTVRASLDVSDMVSGVNAASSVLRNFRKTQEDAFAPKVTDVIGTELLKVNDQLKVQDNLFRNLGLSAVRSAGQAQEAWSTFDTKFRAQAIAGAESRFEAEVEGIRKSAAIQKQLNANLGISTSQGRFDPRESAFNALPENFDRMSARAQKATYSIRSIGTQLGFTSGAASRFGLVAQQAGYQMQDFAVQVAGGQNALVAFSQQGSQMLGVFGPTGAIAGAALAVGVLAVQMVGLSANSKKAADEAERLRKVFQGLVDARKGLAEVQEAPSDKRQRVAEELAKLAEREAFYKDRVVEVNRQMDAIAPINWQTGDRDTLFPSPELNRLKKSLKRAEANAADIETERLTAEKKLRGLDKEANDKLVGDNVAAITKELNARLGIEEVGRINRQLEGARLSAIYNQSDALKDQLDPMRRIKREAEAISKLRQMGDKVLTQEEADRSLDLLIKPTTIPQSMQVNAGASALGGTYGDGAAVLDIQREVLKVAQQQRDALNRMIQMWSTGSN